MVAPSSSGLRPTLSDSAPMTGSQKKFDRPMHTVTSSASKSDRCSSDLPKVGVYAVIR